MHASNQIFPDWFGNFEHGSGVCAIVTFIKGVHQGGHDHRNMVDWYRSRKSNGLYKEGAC